MSQRHRRRKSHHHAKASGRVKHAEPGSPRHFRVRSLKARTDEKRGLGDRFADVMSAACGSNAFLWINVAWFVVWIVLNAEVIPGLEPFDPYPFGFLTMAVSLEAILLSIFVLISQNRAERIDELRAEIDLQVNLIAEEELTKVLSLVAKIAEKQGIDLSDDADLQEMLAPTNIEKLEHVLESQLEHHSCDQVYDDDDLGSARASATG